MGPSEATPQDGIDLVVILHGLQGGPAGMVGVKAAVEAAYPSAQIMVPALPIGGRWGAFCVQQPEAIAAAIANAIDAEWQKTSYRRIVLIGHSFGAVLARKVVILAYGETPGGSGDGVNRTEAAFEAAVERFRDGRPWADRIHLLVMLAGFNRGWAIARALNWLTSVSWSLGTALGEVMRFFSGRDPTLFGIRQGAPFLTQTRLQWLALMRRPVPPQLTAVQLIGSRDDFVSPADDIDFDIDFVHPDRFRLVEIPQTGHYEVIKMSPPSGEGDQSPGAQRWRRFCTAIAGDREQLAAISTPREMLEDNLAAQPDKAVTDVVFVIHGIRDKGYWTQKVAARIKQVAAEDGRVYRSLTASYGYLAMLPFVFGPVRRRKVEWLMDRYTQAKAQYPGADFSYVGHSNGTYLLARALKDYPAARFKRAVLAGSVIPRNYDWAALSSADRSGGKRIESVLNYVATRDLVVALFPNGLSPVTDLGGAGHTGFDQFKPETSNFYQRKYVSGGHSAAIDERRWHEIADFIVRGTAPPASNTDYRRWRNPLVVLAGLFSTPLLLLLIVVFLAVGVALVSQLFCASALQLALARTCAPVSGVPWGWATALLLYFAFLYTLLTRV